jgi:hypothetical protein
MTYFPQKNVYILIILTTIALISAGILFYQYNYLQQTEEFSGNRHMYGCPGGSITWLEKYVFCKTITDDMKYYNASLKQDINVLPPPYLTSYDKSTPRSFGNKKRRTLI